MSTIVLRGVKGTPLTNAEVDANFNNLNTDKLEAATVATLTNKTINLANNTLQATSAQLAAAVSDETGSGALVFGTSPSIAAPTITGALTLSGGTANGVAYLNGSKVLTTGSALTFDGTSLTAGASAGAGQHIFRTYTSGGFAAIYNGGVTPGSTNYSVVTNATQTTLNAATFVSSEIGGSEQMRLTSTGLGIGTSSPAYKLDVNGTGTFASTVRVGTASGSKILQFGADSPTANNGGAIRFNASSTTTNWQISSNFVVTPGSLEFTPSTTAGGSTWTTPAMTLNSSGNLGLGVTPSAGVRLQLADGQIIGSAGNYIALSANGGYSSGAWRYVSSTSAARYDQDAGVHKWFTAPSGTAGNAISFSQVMTLDSSGNLVVGATATADSSKLYVAGNLGTNGSQFNFRPGSGAQYEFVNRIGAGFDFYVNNAGSLAARIDSSGNLGLGVTPSAWDTYKAFQVTNASLWGAVNNAYVSANLYYQASGGRKYIANGYASEYSQANGVHAWSTAPSGTAGNAISFTQSMTLDASGNLGIGTSSPSTKLHLSDATNPTIRLQDTTYTGRYIDIAYNQNGVGEPDLVISRAVGGSPTTLATLDYSGNLGLGVTPSAWSASAKAIQLANTMSRATALATIFGGVSVLNDCYYGTANDFRYFSGGAAARSEINNGAFAWYTAPSGTAGNAISFTQAMTLDASGRLGIGTSSPGANLHVFGTVNGAVTATISNNSTGASSVAELLLDGQGNNFYIRNYGDGTSSANRTDFISTAGSSYFTFSPSSTERARIDSSGNLLVGTTSGTTYRAQFVCGDQYAILGYNTNTAKAVGDIWNAATTGDNKFFNFITETGGTTRGSIDYNRAGGLTRYNTTSDYRAKDIIGPVQNVGATIDALKVYEGVMKGATQSRPMLIAHEAQEHAPYAVSGVKDEVNKDGTPKFQQIDVSSLVPLLLAEIQSLRARVAALEAA